MTGTDTSIDLSYIRAVRLSNTSLTLSFKTDTQAIGQVTYAQEDSSSIQLTDSALQTDHLFTVTELDPKHGYSFTLSATSGPKHSNDYVVLIAPETVGTPGQSIVPSVQIVSPSGQVVANLSAASSTPPPPTPIVPWWAFALLFALVVCAWIGNMLYHRTHTPPPSPF